MSRRLAFTIAFLAPTWFGAAAHAACYADYKAKRDDPLRLHYGVIELPDVACGDPSRLRQEVESRLDRAEWKLLSIEGTFDEAGLQQRRDSAGQYFLRF